MVHSNFLFLNRKWPMLYNLGSLAEKNIYEDPNTTLIKLGMFGELIVEYIFAYNNLEEPYDDSQSIKIRELKDKKLLPFEIDQILYTIRKARNKAAHERYSSVKDAKVNTSMAFKLAVWFMQTYGDWTYKSSRFIMPEESTTEVALKGSREETAKLTREYEERLTKLQDELKNLRSIKNEMETKIRQQKSNEAASLIKLDEDELRKVIDEQLRSYGWEVDTEKIRFSEGIRPETGRNLAIAQWPTYDGTAGYALFVGLKMVGLVEVNVGNKDIDEEIAKVKTYAANIKEEHNEYVINRWDDYYVPFLFGVNVTKHSREIKGKSGIYFLDIRISTNYPRALKSWYTPEGLIELYEKNIEKASEELKKEPYTYLTDKNGLNLRQYQINAIKAVENAILSGKEKILVSMAPDTGKKRTITGLIYRLIKTKRFKRILFLVDHYAMGIQAENWYKGIITEDLMTFDDIFEVMGIEKKEPDMTTKLHIALLQGVVKRIMSDEEEKPSVDTYDCVIVSEAHCGNILDGETNETYSGFKNQEEYICKYNMVIDYFDASMIGFTTTPNLQSKEMFGEPVFEYTYRDGVIDGFLVDHEVRLLKTFFHKGFKHKTANPLNHNDSQMRLADGDYTIKSSNFPDELSIDVDKYNNKLVNRDFTREALKEILKDINPDTTQKTLIFAVDDSHAGMIVELIKELYKDIGIHIEDEAVMKITGSVNDPDEKISMYKNEYYPTIVVTVDLLTSDIDIPRICNLVFLRVIKSRILYEQMVGRGAGLCNEICKTCFKIYDAVGVCELFKPFTNMKPVIENDYNKFKTLFDGLVKSGSRVHEQSIIDKIIAKLQKDKLMLSEKDRDEFMAYGGGLTPEMFIDKLKYSDEDIVISMIKNSKKLFNYLDSVIYNSCNENTLKKEELIKEDFVCQIKEKNSEENKKELKKNISNVDIADRLNKLCTDLNKEGLTYRQYVTELTYILFLKMFEENGGEENIPEQYRWSELVIKEGAELKNFYRRLLLELGEKGEGRIKEIFSNANNYIQKPKDMEKIIKYVDLLDLDCKGKQEISKLYKYLLKMTKEEEKSCGIQNKTMDMLMEVIVELINPQSQELCHDPVADTFDFMIAASEYVKKNSNLLLNEREGILTKRLSFTGYESLQENYILALMNGILHNVEGMVYLVDPLLKSITDNMCFDVIMTNPTFAVQNGGEQTIREDITYISSNNELNYLQLVYRSLKEDGKARAAVIVSDIILAGDRESAAVRIDLMNKCSLHTVLRLPVGITGGEEMKTNVLFFTKGEKDMDNTKEVWFYDLRTKIDCAELKEEDLNRFKMAYQAIDRNKVKDKRLSKHAREEMLKKGDCLDIGIKKFFFN